MAEEKAGNTPTLIHDHVYRISTEEEWKELQRTGSIFGGDLDKQTGCIHLSTIEQVKAVLNNFFRGREGLYLLQIDARKLGNGLIYEAVDDVNFFPHFYGPDRSFRPLRLDVVLKAEKLSWSQGEFTCSFLI
ncbi:hypothetical protein AMTRI_Chr02g262590 [Amborella trichopoda]|uniref:uncharacterized protein LOC105420427 isoform X1 n=1 Tax=Amborella trichopoda TaxID=13333 RepID=UPI0005D38EEB|nr:uncharacterized protein LOC105420427 isoform X1 [Amborella trichopoda]XP_011622278.1 uncharacterized protein LOC105420427 isoform X2 [Amborella trichopoda]|eukprot:XP_011622277.1 uncharacterized protein LOC105420427 isoform X1 [Amborella trichopoda]